MDKWEDETLSNDNQNMHNSITLSGAKNKKIDAFFSGSQAPYRYVYFV